MCPIFKISRNLMGCLWMVALMVSTSAVVSHAATLNWEDFRVPFKQTFSFSTAETVSVRVTLPAEVLTRSEHVSIFCRIDKNSPRLRPYLMVNNNRNAFHYLRGNGVVNIRSEHLKAGLNELLFGDQTTTGDLIFVYELRLHNP